jgi:hypothetical protein
VPQVPWGVQLQVPWGVQLQVPWGVQLQVPWGVQLQVPWGVQLLVSTIEEAAKYAASTAALCNVTDVQLPRWVYARNGLTVTMLQNEATSIKVVM